MTKIKIINNFNSNCNISGGGESDSHVIVPFGGHFENVNTRWPRTKPLKTGKKLVDRHK